MITRPAHPLRLLIAVLMAACAACALQETTPVKPTPDGGERMGESQERSKGPLYEDPQLVVGRGGELYLLWVAVEERKNWDILFSRSVDFGVTWSTPPVSLKPEKATAISGLRMAGDPHGRLSVVWREVDRDTRRRDLFFMHSEDGGEHWDEGKRLLRASPDPGPPHLLVDQDGGILVAWLKGPKGKRFLQVANSYNAGATFASDPIRLSPAFPASEYGITNPQFASDGEGRLYAVWEESKTRSDFRIYLNRSSDRGQTWQMQPILVNTPEEGDHQAHNPQIIAAPKGRVYVVWVQFEQRMVNPHQPGEVIIHKPIYFNRSLDNGQTWLPQPIRLNEAGPGPMTSFVPQLSSDQSEHVYAIWMEPESSSLKRLLFARSGDSGLTWSDLRVRLDLSSPFGGLPAFPEIRSDDAGHVWVLWQELSPDQKRWQLLMNRSDDRGLTWRPHAILLASSPQRGGGYRGVTFEHDGHGRLYVAWDGGPKNVQEIYVNRSADFGATWLSREVQVSQR